jgi:hypothetical protein
MSIRSTSEQWFSDGRDLMVTFIIDGQSREFHLMESFCARRIESGWAGQFGITRVDGDLERFVVTQDLKRHRGEPLSPISIITSVVEEDESITQLEYTDCEMFFENSGTWVATSTVNQVVGFTAKFRFPVSRPDIQFPNIDVPQESGRALKSEVPLGQCLDALPR